MKPIPSKTYIQPEFDSCGYRDLPIQGGFAAAMTAVGMNCEQVAEDLRITGIMNTDPSNVRRWARQESWPPRVVWDRLEKIRLFTMREFTLPERRHFGMPPAAKRFRWALLEAALRAENPRAAERDAADPAMNIKLRRPRRKA